MRRWLILARWNLTAVRGWWRAEPWKWDLRQVYRELRAGAPERGVPPRGRALAAWYALTFPHVHGEEEA
jgi:hypothetical protein